MRVIPVFLLVPIACCVNVTRGVPRLDTLLVGTWDVFCGAGTDATLVQHKLELNVTDGDGLVGTASVVSDATFYPVAYWQVILDEGGGGSSGSIVGSSKAGDEPHDFICRIDLHEIAPGVVGSVAIGGGERCAVTLRAENGTQAHLTLEIYGSSGTARYSVAGSRRRSMAEAPFWTRYGYYLIMGTIVLGQVAFRIYTQRRAPAEAAKRRESQRATVRARIERAAAAAVAAVAAGHGTAGAADAALSAGSEDDDGDGGEGGTEEHDTTAAPPTDAAAKKAE